MILIAIGVGPSCAKENSELAGLGRRTDIYAFSRQARYDMFPCRCGCSVYHRWMFGVSIRWWVAKEVVYCCSLGCHEKGMY